MYRQLKDHIAVVDAAEIRYPVIPSWRPPRIEEIRYLVQTRGGQYGPDTLLALSEIYELAAEMVSVLSEGVSDQIAELQKAAEIAEAERQKRIIEAEKDRALRMEQMRIQRETERLRQVHLYDAMKWQIGEYMKCRRDGYRPTSLPQGTIDRVDERGMHITTEKKKYMFIEFRLVNKLWLRDEGRVYNVVYEAGQESEVKNDD